MIRRCHLAVRGGNQWGMGRMEKEAVRHGVSDLVAAGFKGQLVLLADGRAVHDAADGSAARNWR